MVPASPELEDVFEKPRKGKPTPEDTNPTAREESLRNPKVEGCYDLNVTCPSRAKNRVPAGTAIVGGYRNFDVGPSLRKWRLGFEVYICP